MPKEEWGVKRVCPKCATRFYDLQNDPMTCPSCGAIFDAASLVQQRSRMSAAETAPKSLQQNSQVVDDDDEINDLEDESLDDLDDDLDDDLLDDDDDDDTVNLEEIADMPESDDEG